MKVGQLHKVTGISGDYYNEYFTKKFNLERGLSVVAKHFKEYPVKKYTERFPPEIYEDAITELNKDRVRRLDELAVYANENFIDADRFTEDDFKRHMNEVCDIMGKSRPFPELTE